MLAMHRSPSLPSRIARSSPRGKHVVDDFLMAAEANAPIPSGLRRCVVRGGGFSGAGEEVGLMRARTPPPVAREDRLQCKRTPPLDKLVGMPCSIGPWGEAGVLRLPGKEVIEKEKFRKYKDEMERRIRLKLEEEERRKYAENASSLADLFGRLEAKHYTIQEDKRAARANEIALAQFELEKYERRRREKAAIKIQSWMRGIWARRHYRLLRSQHQKKIMQKRLHKWSIKRRELAAVHIQRIWRGWVMRKRYREMRAMMWEDWLARRIRKHLLWLSMEASRKELLRKRQIKAARSRIKNIYSARAAVRIQSWFRGWRTRRELARARWLRMRQFEEEALQDATDLERLRRIRREAEHTSSQLSGHQDMKMVNRVLKQRDCEDHERLTGDLRKVRKVARGIEANLQEESDLNIVPLRDLSDFLEGQRLRDELDTIRQEGDLQQLMSLRQALVQECELQSKIEHNQHTIDCGKIRHEARKVIQDMEEVQDGTNVFGRMQDFRRNLNRRRR